MRNFKIPKLGCIALMLFIAAGTDAWAGKEELATSTDDQAVTENGTEVGVGKFFKLPFHISVSVRGGYDDNVLSSPDAFRQESGYVEGTLGISYSFGNSRTTVDLHSDIGYTDYFQDIANATSDFHPNMTLTATHKVSQRLTLSLASYLTYQQQPDFTNNFIGIDRRSGNYFFTDDKLSATYVWKPRFSTVTSYRFVAINYEDTGVGTFQNRTENTIGNEFRFLLLPMTSLIGEYRFEFIAYDTPTFQSRDSITNYLLGGFDHNFSPRFNVSVRAGVSIRKYDGVDDARLDPYGQASLVYTAGPHLTLSANASYSLEEPDVVGSPSRTSLQTGLTGTYKITPRIAANLSVFYEHDENDGVSSFFFFLPPFSEDVVSLSANVHYTLNRNWGLELGYAYTEATSGESFRDYDKSRYFGGLNFQF